MTAERMERRLAAILAADVAGYSRLGFTADALANPFGPLPGMMLIN